MIYILCMFSTVITGIILDHLFERDHRRFMRRIRAEFAGELLKQYGEYLEGVRELEEVDDL